MAPRFWVGGTGTWDSATTTNWAATSGGAGGQSVPGSADDVTFDGASGGGTVTVNFGGLITINSLTCGAHTGTLTFAANNNSVTILSSSAVALNASGSGTRTFDMGSGTWTFSGAAAGASFAVTTGLTPTFNNCTIAFTGTATAYRRFNGGGKTFGTITANSSTNYPFALTGANTIGTLTVATPNRIIFPAGTTTIITNFTNMTGTVSAPLLFTTSDVFSGVSTISSPNNWTADYAALSYLTFTGGGTFAATNSYNAGNNTNIAITPPVVGGASGVIGG